MRRVRRRYAAEQAENGPFAPADLLVKFSLQVLALLGAAVPALAEEHLDAVEVLLPHTG
jgi:hypothetical protein